MNGMSKDGSERRITEGDNLGYYFIFGDAPVEVEVAAWTYETTGNLAFILVPMEETDDAEFGQTYYLTTDFNEIKLEANMAFIDVYSMGYQAVEFLEKYGFAKDTGRTQNIGFTTYPLYEFDRQKLRTLRHETAELLPTENFGIDSIEEFCHVLCEELNKKVNKEERFVVKTYECEGAVKYSIQIDLEGWRLPLGSSIEPIWERYDCSGQMDTFVEIINNDLLLFKKKLDKDEPWDTEDIEANKSHIGFRIVNSAFLPKEIAHVPYKDMEVIFEAQIAPKAGLRSVIKEQDLKDWGLSPEEAFELAKQNMPRLLPARVISIEQLVYPFQCAAHPIDSPRGMEILEQGDMEFVLRNETEVYGAGTILYSGVAKYIAEKVRCNFYILIPTVNDAMIIPVKTTSGKDPETLKAYLKGLEYKDAPEEARLSQTLFYYDAEKDEIFAVE